MTAPINSRSGSPIPPIGLALRNGSRSGSPTPSPAHPSSFTGGAPIRTVLEMIAPHRSATPAGENPDAPGAPSLHSGRVSPIAGGPPIMNEPDMTDESRATTSKPEEKPVALPSDDSRKPSADPEERPPSPIGGSAGSPLKESSPIIQMAPGAATAGPSTEPTVTRTNAIYRGVCPFFTKAVFGTCVALIISYSFCALTQQCRGDL